MTIKRSPTRLVLLGAAILLALALWAMRTILGPLLCTAALCFILWPYREDVGVRRVLIASVLLLILWILIEARAIVYPALAALAFAFLLDPAVNRLSRGRLPRALAALAVLLPILAGMLFVLLVLVPSLVDQMRTLIEQVPSAYETVRGWIVSLLSRWSDYIGPEALPREITDLLPQGQKILEGALTGAIQVGRGVAAAVNVAAFMILTPILTYYLLVDFEPLRNSVRPYVTDEHAGQIQKLGTIFQESVGAWLKGQLLVALITGVLATIGFVLIGLPYALLLGLLAGVLNLVPILGFWVSFLLSLTAALFAPSPLPMLAKAAAVLLATQLLEQNLYSPRIVGKQLGVKPVILLVTMLGMSVFFGVLGVFLAAPVIGLSRGMWALWGPRPVSAVTPVGDE